MNVTVLYEDTHIFVVVKPAGMPSQSERSSAMDMVSYLKNLLVKRDHVRNPYVAVIHRLDRPVGGVMVYAKTPKAARELSDQMARHHVQKTYTAVLCGDLPQREGRLENLLIKDGKTNLSSVVLENADAEVKKAAKKAVLNYQVLCQKNVRDDHYTLVKIQLETGRHHQIRVQMAYAGAPVAGDTKYGKTPGKVSHYEAAFRTIGLFSSGLEFTHPITGKRMQFCAEPAGDVFEMMRSAAALQH